MEYKPDIIISVHPLMQHIPLWVLKWQGLQKKVIFVTVITDLNTCHRTWLVDYLNKNYLCLFKTHFHILLIVFNFGIYSGFILGLIDATALHRR